jgi:hypothetical protein
LCGTTPARHWPAISLSVTATFRLVYVFLVLEIGTRRIVHWNVTEHPTSEWTVQPFRSCVTGDQPYRFVVHDRDAVFSPALDTSLTSMNLQVLKTPHRVPQAKDSAGPGRSRGYLWAELMRRTFGIDVLDCARCAAGCDCSR